MLQLPINTPRELQELVVDTDNARSIFDAMAYALSLWSRVEITYARDMNVVDDEIGTQRNCASCELPAKRLKLRLSRLKRITKWNMIEQRNWKLTLDA